MSESSPTPVKWDRIVVVAVLIVLAVRAAVVPLFAVSMADYPIDYVVAEGDQLVYLQQLLHGQTIYSDSSGYPLQGNVYPPVFPFVMWLAAHVAPTTMAMLRILCLVPLLGSMAIVGLFLRRAGAPGALILAGMLLVPCGYSSAQYLTYVRCDGWMTLFALASLYFLSDLPASGSLSRQMLLGALFAALALFTKQTAVFGVAAMLLHLLITRWRQGVAAVAATAGFCGVLLGLSLWRFGPVLLEAMFHLTVRRTFDADRFGAIVVPDVSALAALIGLALVRMAIHAVSRTWDLLDTYLVGFSATMGLVLFDCGGTNYVLPAAVGAALAAALCLTELLRTALPRKLLLAGGVAVLALHLFMQLPYGRAFTAPGAEELAEARYAAEFLTSTDEPVYCERFWAPVADRESTLRYFVEPTHLRTLPPGRLQQAAFEEPFRNKVFKRMLIYYPDSYHYRGFTKMLEQYYRIVRVGKLRVCFGVPSQADVAYLVPK